MTANYPNNNGCKNDTFRKTIQVNKRPYFSLGVDTNLCNGVFYQISPVVEPNLKYRWHNSSTSNLIVVNTNQLVWLTLTDSNQCSFTDSILIQFINCDTNSLIIPNVFTPSSNGNGSNNSNDINDFFETKFTGFDNLKGYIYNRWGNVVYSFDYPNDEYWNGGFLNDLSRPCPAGTYYYIFEFSSSTTNQKKPVNGVVQLIR
jgi:gliding motility-associated-like protein